MCAWSDTAATILPVTTSFYICEAFGFEAGIDKNLREAPQFYGLFTSILAIGVATWVEELPEEESATPALDAAASAAEPASAPTIAGEEAGGGAPDEPEAPAILAKLREKLPNTKVLLLGIFPRSANATDPMRVINDQANELIAKFADNKNVYYLNINKTFLTEKGELTKDIMPDLLHPNAKGYELMAPVAAAAIEKALQ